MDKVTKSTFKVPIYFGTLTVVVCSNIQEAIDEMGIQFNANGFAAISANRTTNSGYRRYVIIIRGDANAGEIAHEAKHIVNMIFSFTGVKLDTKNDEAECYLLGWIVNRVTSVYKKHINAEPGATI